MPFDPSKKFTVEAAPAFDPAKKFEVEAPAAPAAAGPKPSMIKQALAGALTQPLAGTQMGLGDLVAGNTGHAPTLLDKGLQLGDQLYRTYAGAGTDALDAITSTINNPINAVLKGIGIDAQIPTHQLKNVVPQPVGAIPQFTRAAAPYFIGPGAAARGVEAAGAKLLTRGAELAPTTLAAIRVAPGAAKAGAVGGAAVDAVLSNNSDKNLSNVVADLGGPTLPTARVPGENPGVAAAKDMAEGGIIGAAVELGLKFFTRGAAHVPGTPEGQAEEAAVQAAVADPQVRAQLEASGITPETSPRYAEFVARAEQRQAEDAARAADPLAQAQPETFRAPSEPAAAPDAPAGVPPEPEPQVAAPTSPVPPAPIDDVSVPRPAPRAADPAVPATLDAPTAMREPPAPSARVDPVPVDEARAGDTPIAGRGAETPPETPLPDPPPVSPGEPKLSDQQPAAAAPATAVPAYGEKSTNTPAPVDAEGRFPVTEQGHVRSDTGGPIVFKDQDQAAKWVATVGGKQPPDQVFDVVDHPTIKTGGAGRASEAAYSIKERAPEALDGSATGGEAIVSPPARAEAEAAAGVNSASPRSAEDVGVEPPVGDRAAGTEPEKANTDVVHSRPEPTPDDTEAEAAAQAIHDKMKARSGGTRLYSGLDPEAVKTELVEPAARMIRREMEGVREGVAYLHKLGSVLKGSVSPAAVGSALGSFTRKVYWSNAGAMQHIARKWKDVPEALEMSDHLATDPGRGRVIKQTYERAVEMQSLSKLNALSNLLGKKANPQLEGNIADILAGRKAPRAGSTEATVAQRVRGVLDSHLQYLKDAGLEVGYAKGYFPRVLDEDLVVKNGEAFKTAASELYRGMGLDGDKATEAAANWYSRVLGVKDGAYSSGLPASKFTKGRTLPADADKIMADFYQRDLRDNLASYFSQTSRSAEFARRFGANGDKAQEMFNAMLKKGVDRKDVDQLRHNFESATGMAYSSRPNVGTEALGWIQVHGTFKLLPRAVISSLTESLVAGMRAHDVGAGMKSLADSYAQLFHLREPDEADQVARMVGIVGDAVNDMVLQSNMGGGEMIGGAASQGGRIRQDLMHKFFTVTGLHQITGAQRTSAVRIGQGFVAELVHDITTGNSRSKSALRLAAELGIDEPGARTLAKWMVSDDGRLPVGSLMSEHPDALRYRTAIQRFVDESIQNPTAADRPELAGHPIGKLAYAITSFQFSFTRNVLLRTMRETSEALNVGKGYTWSDRARFAAPAAGLAMLSAATLGVNAARNKTLNRGTTSEQSYAQNVISGLSRASLFGNADPFVNVITSSKYKRDLTSLLTGAYLTSDLANISNLTIGLLPKSWGGPNTPATNNAEWQAAKSGYELLAIPAMSLAASLAPGGPAMRAGFGAGLVAGTSPDSARGFADSVAGERKIKPGVGHSSSGSTTDDFGAKDMSLGELTL